MKKIFTIILLTLSLNSYSQESFIGKTKQQIEVILNKPTREIIFNKKASLYVEVDSNISDIYSFNSNNICIEYNRLYSHENMETIEHVFLKDFKRSMSMENLWINDSEGTMAIIKTANGLCHISIQRNKYY